MMNRTLTARRSAARWALISSVVILASVPAEAVDKGKAKYVGGTLAGVPIGTEAKINLDDPNSLIFGPQVGAVEIPWAAVDGVEYWRTEGRSRGAVGAVVTGGWSLLFTKGRKHRVTLSYRDAREVSRVVVFEFDKDDIRLALSLIRFRSGKEIACEGEDVKAPIAACSGSVQAQAPEVATNQPVAPVVEPSAPRKAGPRVRVFAPTVSGAPIHGELVASDETTITIRATHDSVLDRTYGKTISVPYESVTRLERSVRPSKRRTGAAIGMALGFVAGVSMCFLRDDCDDGDSVYAGAVLASPLGFIGFAAAPGERWAAEDPKQMRLGSGPATGRGVRFALSVRF